MKALIEVDRHITVREIVEKVNVSIRAVHKYFKKLGIVKKLDKWVPHKLIEVYFTQRSSAVHIKRQ